MKTNVSIKFMGSIYQFMVETSAEMELVKQFQEVLRPMEKAMKSNNAIIDRLVEVFDRYDMEPDMHSVNAIDLPELYDELLNNMMQEVERKINSGVNFCYEIKNLQDVIDTKTRVCDQLKELLDRAMKDLFYSAREKEEMAEEREILENERDYWHTMYDMESDNNREYADDFAILLNKYHKLEEENEKLKEENDALYRYTEAQDNIIAERDEEISDLNKALDEYMIADEEEDDDDSTVEEFLNVLAEEIDNCMDDLVQAIEDENNHFDNMAVAKFVEYLADACTDRDMTHKLYMLSMDLTEHNDQED